MIQKNNIRLLIGFPGGIGPRGYTGPTGPPGPKGVRGEPGISIVVRYILFILVKVFINFLQKKSYYNYLLLILGTKRNGWITRVRR